MRRRRKVYLRKRPRIGVLAALLALLLLTSAAAWWNPWKGALASGPAAKHPSNLDTTNPSPVRADIAAPASASNVKNYRSAPRHPIAATAARTKAVGSAGRAIDQILREMETAAPKKKGGAKANARIGFLASAQGDGAVVTSHYPDQLLSGASNIKLYTTAAALLKLGPAFRFETKFASDANINNGVLEGDLWILGGGDPTLTSQDRFCEGGAAAALTRAAAELTNRGIRRVRGSIVLDDRYFSDARYHPGWPSHDRGKAHALDVSALCAEHHKISIEARAAGARAELEIWPPMAGVRVENSVQIVAKGQGKGIVARLDGDALRVSGSLSPSQTDATSFFTLDGTRLFGFVALRAFENCNITVDGGARSAALLDGAPKTILVTLQSPATLADVIRVTNRESDNLYAEMILKTLGARFRGAGTSAAGVEVVRETLGELGVPLAGYAAVDGCGLARESKISPAATVALLRAMAETKYYDIYKNSLAGPGDADGTLRKRLRDPIFNDRVRAKTGSLDGATSLSGYVDARSGETFIFSCITNYTEFGGSFKPDEDRCVRELVEIDK